MHILIILVAVWMGAIPFTLTEAKAQEPVVIQVDWAEPCYDAPCSKTCQHGANFDELIACYNEACRHNNNDTYLTGLIRCNKCISKEVSDEEGYETIRTCNGFKREELECKMPEYKS